MRSFFRRVELDHRTWQCHGIVEEQGALAADRLELVAVARAVAQSKTCEHVSGEAQGRRRQPVGAGGAVPGVGETDSGSPPRSREPLTQ